MILSSEYWRNYWRNGRGRPPRGLADVGRRCPDVAARAAIGQIGLAGIVKGIVVVERMNTTTYVDINIYRRLHMYMPTNTLIRRTANTHVTPGALWFYRYATRVLKSIEKKNKNLEPPSYPSYQARVTGHRALEVK